MKKDKNISLRVDKSLYEYIQTAVERHNMTQTEFIEYAILNERNSNNGCFNIDFINDFMLLFNWYQRLKNSIADDSLNLNINDGGILIEKILDNLVK